MQKFWIVPLTGLAFFATPACALPDPSPAPAAPVVAASPFGEASAISGADLSQVAGQADIAMTVRAQNTSTVSNNSVSGQSQTGSVTFDAQSLSNLNGLSLLSANTGNNVSINASLNVNIAILP